MRLLLERLLFLSISQLVIKALFRSQATLVFPSSLQVQRTLDLQVPSPPSPSKRPLPEKRKQAPPTKKPKVHECVPGHYVVQTYNSFHRPASVALPSSEPQPGLLQRYVASLSRMMAKTDCHNTIAKH